jgi:hypothetical protein
MPAAVYIWPDARSVRHARRVLRRRVDGSAPVISAANEQGQKCRKAHEWHQHDYGRQYMKPSIRVKGIRYAVNDWPSR